MDVMKNQMDATAVLGQYQRSMEKLRMLKKELKAIDEISEIVNGQICLTSLAPEVRERAEELKRDSCKLSDEILLQSKRCLDMISEASNLIDMVKSETDAMILRYYFIDGYSVLKISNIMHYSYRWILERKARALDEVQGILSRGS